MYGDGTYGSVMAILRLVLADQVGTFADGRKAFWDDQHLRPDMGSGLLVILRREPIRVNYAADQWMLSLVQHDRSVAGVGKFNEAIANLKDQFPLNRGFVVLDGGDGQPLQATTRLLFYPEAYENINGRIIPAPLAYLVFANGDQVVNAAGDYLIVER